MKLGTQIGSVKIDDLITEKIDTRINEIMQHRRPDDLPECGMPADSKPMKTGWYKWMLSRYIFSTQFTEGITVLDLCCGVGWGSYIIGTNAKKIIAVDYQKKALEYLKNNWKNTKNIETVNFDVLKYVCKEPVDIVLMMDCIEHLSIFEGVRVMLNVFKSLKPDGIVIGSSGFPATREQAKKSESKFHKHVYTLNEITMLLKTFFKDVKVLENKYFICKEKKLWCDQ